LSVALAASTIGAIATAAAAVDLPKPAASIQSSIGSTNVPLIPGSTTPYPTPPDIDALDQGFPHCKAASNPELEACRSDLETYRVLRIEGFRRSADSYAQRLKTIDARVEKRHASVLISDDDFQDAHDYLAQEIHDSTYSDGKYLSAYAAEISKYKSRQQIILEAENKCIIEFECNIDV
jgi:hypothetical protein